MERSRSKAGIPHPTGNGVNAEHHRPDVPRVPTRPGETPSHIYRGPERRTGINPEPPHAADGRPAVSSTPSLDRAARAARSTVSDLPPADHAKYELPPVNLSIPATTDVFTYPSSPTPADAKERHDNKPTTDATVTVPPQRGGDPATNAAPGAKGAEAPAEPLVVDAGGGKGPVPPIDRPTPAAPGEEPEPRRSLSELLEGVAREFERKMGSPAFRAFYEQAVTEIATIRETVGQEEPIPPEEQDRILAAMLAISRHSLADANARAAQERDEKEMLRTTALAALSSAAERLGKPFEAAQKAATTDALTGIPNRRGFTDAASELFNRAQTEGTSLAYLFIDADNFKSINEAFTHVGGDKAIQMMASAIKESVREGDAFGRPGGDEFNILLNDVTPQEAGTIASRIQIAIVQKSAHVNMRFTASIGISLIEPGDNRSLAEHATAADIALLRAKEIRPTKNSILFATEQNYGTINPKYLPEE